MRNNYSCLRLKKEKRVVRNVPEYNDTGSMSIEMSRPCLKCGKKFLSTGLHNRLCKKCTSINNNISAREFCVNRTYVHELTQ